MSGPCRAAGEFAQGDTWPKCHRPAEVLVRYTDRVDLPRSVETCGPCSVLFTVHKPSLHATVEPLDGAR